MKRTQLAILSLIIFTPVLQAQIHTFQRTFPASAKEYVGSPSATANNKYIIGGSTTSFGNGGEDAFLLKVNNKGVEEWSRTYGDAMSQQIIYTHIDATGSIWFCGYTETAGNGEDAIFGEADSTGNINWIKTYGGTGNERIRKILPGSSNDYYLIGYTTSGFGAGGTDMYLIKVDQNGDLIWDRSYGGAGEDRFRDADFKSNGNLVVVGFSSSFGANNDAVAAELDTSGTVIWSNGFDSQKSDKWHHVQVVNNDELIVAGSTKLDINGTTNPIMSRLSSTGSSIWSKVYLDTVYTNCFSVVNAHDGGLIMMGDSYPAPGRTDTQTVFFAKTDINGVLDWSMTVGGSGDERRPRMLSTVDGGYFSTFYTTSFVTDTNHNIYVIKMDANGNSGCNTNSISFGVNDTTLTIAGISLSTGSGSTQNNLSWTGVGANFVHDTLCQSLVSELGNHFEDLWELLIYPNPSSQFVYLSEPVEKLELVNFLGQSLMIKNNTNVIDIGHLASGNYLLKITDGNRNCIRKLMVTK